MAMDIRLIHCNAEPSSNSSSPFLGHKVPQEVIEQLLEVDQPGITLSVEVVSAHPLPFLSQYSSIRLGEDCVALNLISTLHLVLCKVCPTLPLRFPKPPGTPFTSSQSDWMRHCGVRV